MKYIIRIFTDIKDHWESQEIQRFLIYDSGAEHAKWLAGTIFPNGGKRSHVWEIHCNEETLTLIRLKAETKMEHELRK